MPKTDKELQDLKIKVEEVSRELKELSDEELDRVAGGTMCNEYCKFDTLFNQCICPDD